jgi:hypothetical protein
MPRFSVGAAPVYSFFYKSAFPSFLHFQTQNIPNFRSVHLQTVRSTYFAQNQAPKTPIAVAAADAEAALARRRDMFAGMRRQVQFFFAHISIYISILHFSIIDLMSSQCNNLLAGHWSHC